MKPKLIVLRGNSGSGKSTLARKLQHRLGRNTMVIAQDTIRREMLWVRDEPGTPAVALLTELLRYGHAHSNITILEGILYADIYQPLFEEAVNLFGQEQIFAYYYDIPFEETLTRHQTKPNRADFGEEAMRKWWREKDLSAVLSEQFLTAEITLEAAEEKIYTAVT